ncbi:nitroreductase [Marinifilum breve]|uniref:Nitroreductase n=1 Tax=Marinifilum breve TaxID=2184082 RepID=A0A2V4A072_9BACT|nr:nitroreductase family protein [Marinifilum breve]PXY01976.1 nitroreductase [Marinifilum breve]
MNNMLDFKVDESKCTTCGLCAGDCPMGIINMNQLPSIESEEEQLCLKCQHCMAVCPTGALSILGKEPENSLKNSRTLPDPKLMSEMIKNRRSVRKYKKEVLDKEFINELLETASYAPTGHNDNGVHFTVIDETNTMQQFREMVYASIKKAGDAGEIKPPMDFIYGLQKLWEHTGEDRLFWKAPHLVIASAPSTNVTPVEDSLIALSYFELLVNANGIGTLWDGMIKWAINDLDTDLRKALGIPGDHKIGYAMLFGKPAIKYPRAIQSEGIHISSVSLK